MPVEVQRKLTVLGYPGVGKSSLTTCFVENRFVEDYDPTIENTFHKTIRVHNAHFVMDIVDTAGMDEYANFSQAASVGVHGYVLVYSIGFRTSFKKLKLINEKLVNMLGAKPPRVLVGSMSDLDKSREVSVEEGQMLASNWECPFVECSAKDNENINEVFTYLIKEIERDSGLLEESAVHDAAAAKTLPRHRIALKWGRRGIVEREEKEDTEEGIMDNCINNRCFLYRNPS